MQTQLVDRLVTRCVIACVSHPMITKLSDLYISLLNKQNVNTQTCSTNVVLAENKEVPDRNIGVRPVRKYANCRILISERASSLTLSNTTDFPWFSFTTGRNGNINKGQVLLDLSLGF